MLLGMLLLPACEGPPVEWAEPHVASAPGTTDALALAVDAGREVRLVAVEAQRAPSPAGACAGTVQVVPGAGARRFAAWWSGRPDGGATLVASRSDDSGATWSPAVRVDTADAGGTGCARPAPAMAVQGDVVYLAYAMRAREGPGVFFAHSMDAGAMYHWPVAVVYGAHPLQVAIAAEGDRVAVAYDDPNSATPRVALALSRTQGHIFEERMTASTDVGAADDPRVALRGGVIAVAWRQNTRSMERNAAAASAAAWWVRSGTLR
ncbi:MAG: hypothetical protein JWO05_1489 [Gemmatimonadetes bacterium]|nr:hypothetical protein [Gemmatimonadota bacterium]